MTDRKAVIKNADMSEDMQTDAVECATQALEKYNIEKDIAAFIKKEFDKKYRYLEFLRKLFPKMIFFKILDFFEKFRFFIEILAFDDFDFFGKIVFLCLFIYFFSPTWHCIVGRNFGSYVTHETKHFIYFYLGQVRLFLTLWPFFDGLGVIRLLKLFSGCYSLVQIWISEFLPKLSARQQRSHLIHHLVEIPLKVNQLSLCNINKYY